MWTRLNAHPFTGFCDSQAVLLPLSQRCRSEMRPAARSLQVSDSSNTLVQIIRPVQRVALLGDETRAANQTPQFFFRGLVVGACRAHYIFLDHHAAYVVPAKTQTQLAGFQSRRHP